jgi:WD40 repeat protein
MRSKKYIGLFVLIFFVIFFGGYAADAGLSPKIEMVFQKGNDSDITCLAFSADSSVIMSGSQTGDVAFWDYSSGRQIRSLQMSERRIISGMWMSDKTTLIVLFDNSAAFVDVKSGTVKKTFTARSGKLQTVLADGKTALVLNGNKVIAEDIESGKLNIVYEHVQPFIKSFNAFSAAGARYCLLVDLQDKCFVFDTVAMKAVKEVESLEGRSSMSGAVSPNGRTALLSRGKNQYLVSMPEGKAERIIFPGNIRVPSVNTDSKLAFTPDGRSIVYADYGWKLRYDISSKTCASVFSNSSDVMIAFSPDGKKFVTASDRGDLVANVRDTSNMISVYDASTLVRIKEMTANSLSQQDTCCVTHDGRYLITGGYSEKFIRIWDLKYGTLAQRLPTGSRTGWTDIRLSPDNKVISVLKDSDFLCFSIEDWRVVTKENFGRDFHYVWFPDSERIAVAGKSGLKTHSIQILTVKTGRKNVLVDGEYPKAVDIAVSPDGNFIAIAGQTEAEPITSSLRIIRADGGTAVRNLGGMKWGVRGLSFTDDGKKILGITNGTELVEWSISDGSSHVLLRGVRSFQKLPGGKLSIVGDGISILDIGSGAITPTAVDGSLAKEHLALAGSGYHHPSSPVIFFSCYDGGIRMVHFRTGGVTVFCGNKTNSDWLMFNRDGFWDANGGGSSMVAARKGNDIFAIDQFAIRYNRPDLVLAGIPGVDPEAIAHFAAEYERRCRRMGVNPSSPDSVRTVPVIQNMKVMRNGKTASVTFQIVSNGAKVSKYNIFMNGVPVFGAEGKIPRGTSVYETVELIPGKNVIEASCVTSGGIESIRVGTAEELNDYTLGNLYFIGLGVSVYKNESLRLKYADKDIRDLSDALRSVYGPARYKSLVLTNEEVTADAAEKAKKFLSTARSEDVVILSIAGHGVHDNDPASTYYFLTHETDLSNLAGSAMNFEKVESIMQGIAPRKKLFLMDTCESGESEPSTESGYYEKAKDLGISARTTRAIAAVKKKGSSSRSAFLRTDRFIYNDLMRRSGAIVFSSCRGSEFSYEQDAIRNGYFTRSIIEALSGKADTDKNGSVSVDELRNFVSDDVAKKTGDLQHPTIDRDNINIMMALPYRR